MKRSMSIAILVLAGFVVAVTAQWVTAKPRTFTAHLSGSGETPAVPTKARGNAVFQLNADGTEMSYRLIVANIENVRFSHIHMAPEGQNGPVVVTLFAGPTQQGRVSGVLAEGTITAADLEGPLAGEPLSALIERLDNGRLYVNVHTDQAPPGEIRGQIK